MLKNKYILITIGLSPASLMTPGAHLLHCAYILEFRIDFQIVCDYLESREDVDMQKVSFFGLSWSGFVAPYVLAIEDRVNAGIVSAFGELSGGDNPEYDQVTYLPRKRIKYGSCMSMYMAHLSPI